MNWSDLLIGVGLIAGFVILKYWVLPRLGVPT